MRRQIEGSRGIAEAVAHCRPQVVPAYPITPQTHIVEALGAMVKAGSLTPCEFITVESEFGAMSAAIGASAVVGARAYTATASQGLLYMAEALFNAAGLGLPVVMTVANRAIGAPINIWNDQSDSMSQRDCGWIQLYAPDNQSATDLHILAFMLAEELSIPVMVCVDGFVLTHAFEPIDVPSQEQVDAVLPAYRPRQQLDPAEPVAIGAMVGPEAFTEVRYLSHQMQRAAIETFDQCAHDFETVVGRRLSSVEAYRTSGADTIVFTLGSVSGTVADVIDQDGSGVGLVTLTMYRPFPYELVRSALAGARRVIVLERAFYAQALAGRSALTYAKRSPSTSIELTTVVAGLGGRAVRATSLRTMLDDHRAGTLAPLTFLDLRHDIVDAELDRMSRLRDSGPHALGVLRATGVPASRLHLKGPEMADVKFYQVGTRAVGNRLLDERLRTEQANPARRNSLNSGHRACQGCGEALGARYVLDAAVRATDGRLVAVNATGCLEVFSTPYPESSWQVPWLHSLFANAPAVASGAAAALKAQGRSDIRVVAQGGDGGTVDIGFASLSGMFERNDDVLYVCYDNEAYMNTGVQRSGATPAYARTATTEALGAEPGNRFGQGKDLPRIAMAHEIPYVATATVADPHDLEAKVTRAMSIHGARYLHVLVPCPLGWGADPADTVKLARLAQRSGLFPVYEAEHGEVTAVTAIRGRVPVEEYLRPQKRYGHLFGDPPRSDLLARIQGLADRNIARYRLIEAEGTT